MYLHEFDFLFIYGVLPRKSDVSPNKNARVCSCHFKAGDKTHLPELFAWNKDKRLSPKPARTCETRYLELIIFLHKCFILSVFWNVYCLAVFTRKYLPWYEHILPLIFQNDSYVTILFSETSHKKLQVVFYHKQIDYENNDQHFSLKEERLTYLFWRPWNVTHNISRIICL